ncbi:MAG: virulence factor MviN, partial [Candidatus Nomurabacteria bacterium]|nr:virulence factor MviN [Candidatus Nomurabacteria bacterium]
MPSQNQLNSAPNQSALNPPTPDSNRPRPRKKNAIGRLLARANSRFNIKTTAAMLAGSTLLSALFGIYRDRLINSMYYSTYKVGVDAYTAAFTIPDFMYTILVTGALAVSFIPVFTERLSKGNKDSAWKMSSSLLNLMGLLTLAVSILIIIFAPALVKYIVAPGLNEQGQALASSLMRVIAVNPFLFALATVINSIQQGVSRFFFFALAPVMYNIGIIIGAQWLTGGVSLFGHQIFAGGIMGVALGVALGAALQLVVSSLGLIGLGFKYSWKIYWKNRGFRKVLRMLPPRSVDQGLDYVSSTIDMNLASRMAEGTIRAYNQATTLYHMPINLIGVAISTAAFPQMTERLGQGRPDLFKKELQAVLRVIVWLALPVAAVMFFARGYIVSILFRGGSGLVVSLLGIFVFVTLLRSVFHIASRSFYANQDTKTPMLISLSSIVVAIAWDLVAVFVWHMGASALAIGQVIWAALEILGLFTIMSRRIKGLLSRDFWQAILRMLIATAFTGVAAYIMAAALHLQ